MCETVGVRPGVGDRVTDPVNDTLPVRVGGVNDAEREVPVTEGLELCDGLAVCVRVRDAVGLRVRVRGDTLRDRDTDEVQVVVGR